MVEGSGNEDEDENYNIRMPGGWEIEDEAS